MNWIKKLLGLKTKKQCAIHNVSKRFCVKYVVDGKLASEYSWFCDATCENMARYDFWYSHNELYHDIISVNVW